MSRKANIVLVAEVGNKVGWGHIARCVLLRRILSEEFCVTMKVVNRENWEDRPLEKKYALNKPVKADIAFFDGLTLVSEALPLIDAPIKVSLSYVSDINAVADWVVTPALHGMDTPSNYVTDLSAILCNQPVFDSMAPESSSPDAGEILVGVCMGGNDTDHVGPAIDNALRAAGYQTKRYAPKSNKTMPLTEFLRRKLEGCDLDRFPYYVMADCDIVVCQGGLSAIEFTLLGIPTVIRRRSDFPDAYLFIESFGCSLSSGKDDIPALVDAVSKLVTNLEFRERTSHARQVLQTEMNGNFWPGFINEMTDLEEK